MIIKTQALYFDGVSSKPHQIELFLDKIKHSLYFETKNTGWINWKTTDVSVLNKSNNFVFFQLKQDPSQSIQVEDEIFRVKLIEYLKDSNNLNWYQKFLNLGFKAHSLIALALMILIGLGYFFVVPWAAENAVTVIPESYDTELGNMVYQETIQNDIVDTKKSKLLNDFSHKIKLGNSKKINFTVVTSDIVNAFALPDGNIVVYTGILNKMKNYDELVALIGHEVAHVNNRHSMKLLCRDLSGYFFISAILGDVNGIMAILGEHANSLQSLSFSREFETQSDEEGLRLMKNNKVNPKGMLDLFSRLQEVEKDQGISVPEFLSSHPVTDDRIKLVKDYIKKNNFDFDNSSELDTIFQSLIK